MLEVACEGGGVFSELKRWLYSTVLFPFMQLEIVDYLFVYYVLIVVKCIFCF